jgi:hypothetical protein
MAIVKTTSAIYRATSGHLNASELFLLGRSCPGRPTRRWKRSARNAGIEAP